MTSPANLDLVLAGGGHSHCLALRMLAMDPIPGLRITLVSPDPLSAYSGMLPGLIAGHYRLEDTHVDLYRLCLATGTRFIQAAVTRIDTAQRRLFLSDGSQLDYDWLSLDVGATPDLSPLGQAVPEQVVPVKPVSDFYSRWRRWLAESDETSLAVVGAGAGGTEMVLAIAEYLRQQQKSTSLSLISGSDLLPGFPHRVRKKMQARLDAYGIRLQPNTVVENQHGTLVANGKPVEADQVLWCTGVRGIGLFENSDLACDERGFVKIHDTLQSHSDSRVFAAGDCAAFPRPLPKAGVYAVRQAKTLAANLRAAIQGHPLQPYRPQTRFLSLLSAGGKDAVASRGGALSLSGGWVWRWKDRIDRAFMDKFQDQLPTMAPPQPDPHALHCAGCGAKVGSDALSEALSTLQPHLNPGIDAGVDTADDAAVIDWPADQRLVQSLDFFPAFIDDPYLFGRIAALHSLSDLYAMNARPHSALANITLNWHHPRLQGRDLQRLMAGAVEELNQAGCTLVGGHTTEGPQMAAGFTVNGAALPANIWQKSGARPGDAIVLTKPLGSGVQLAAMMHGGKLHGDWLATTFDTLLKSNGDARDALQHQPVNACTDITGFGLLGHLLEICQQSDVSMALETDKIPLLPGTLSLIENGVASSLSEANRQSLMQCRWSNAVSDMLLTALCDPQTSGGLLFCLAQETLTTSLQKMADNGVMGTVIGKVLVKDGENPEAIYLQ
ncbi:selenide, water dikinase SelD [Alcanivorax sp. DP30]|uniref:selenide, water dikinase SelD n=1 Tax=Alcanivorax sp. DP30 TaxID=2606217 RepID=UPI0013694C9E|nr:selenide, water dikinase SelD [Alcanivorax sp. DP30]MZR64087.1 selenide, water dikinase SelD [Alcanivorax sp. DP30]